MFTFLQVESLRLIVWLKKKKEEEEDKDGKKEGEKEGGRM